MPRTQEEILNRFLEVDDIFNTQKSDLSNFLQFETVKHMLIPESVEAIEKGDEKWTLYTDPKAQILDYLPFAYDKSRNRRGISAARSLLHMRSWIWLDCDEEFYQKFDSMVGEEGSNEQGDYGLSILDMIAEKYGFVEA